MKIQTQCDRAASLILFAISVFTLTLLLNSQTNGQISVPRPSGTPISASGGVLDQSSLQRERNTRFISRYVEKLDNRLKGKSVGYSFFVTFKNGLAQGRAGGDARRSPDTDARKMTIDDRLNIASVSKTITAAALLKLLNDKSISVDTLVHTYLPSDWKIGTNFNTISFRQLLTHTSGVRCSAYNDVSYAGLKKCVADGIKLGDKTSSYNNSNFGLFRILIARIGGAPMIRVPGGTLDDSKFSTFYAGQYINYVRHTVFAPIGLTGIDAKPAASSPALTYQFPTPLKAGESFGDATEEVGSQGWNMSSKQLAIFLDSLVNTEKILPAAVSKKMLSEQLGIFTDSTTLPGIISNEHTGYFPGANNAGELNSGIFTFSNGLTVAVIINSQFGPGLSLPSEVKAALREIL
ncbi:hypothetical protein BH10ACI3_BH10ACI3_04130 [soil metagenome]